jgi:hypothetical protein
MNDLKIFEAQYPIASIDRGWTGRELADKNPPGVLQLIPKPPIGAALLSWVCLLLTEKLSDWTEGLA